MIAEQALRLAAAGGRPSVLARIWHNANHSYLRAVVDVRLSELKQGVTAVVREVEDAHDADTIARRLRELGFVAGEPVRIVAHAPFGGDPLLVQVGFTRFALRRSEAARVRLTTLGAA
jgi:ferrous iron transport protein A